MKHILLIISSSLLLFNCSNQHPQTTKDLSLNKDSAQQVKPQKKRTIEDLHREWDSANAAERSLPLYMKRMGNLLRDHIAKMKQAGVTRANARSMDVEHKYSTHVFHVDSFGRILMVLSIRDLDIATLKKLENWGVKINIFGYWTGNTSVELLHYFKSRHIRMFTNVVESPQELECNVPFDIVEEVAKLPRLVGLNAILNGTHG